MIDDSATSLNFGPYKFIGTWAGVDTLPIDILILDTNVAIDIERFYYGDSRPSIALRDLLVHFARRGPLEKSVDINYGWALKEATWSHGTQEVNTLRFRRMRHALSKVVEWNAGEITRAFENRHPPVSRDKQWPRSTAMPDSDELEDPSIMILSSYGVLLKGLTVASTHRNLRGDEAVAALGSVVEWARTTLGVMDSYAIQVITDLLCGDAERKTSAQRLLSYSGPTPAELSSKRAANAAWDLFFTRLCEGHTLGLMAGARPGTTNVVTRNVDLPYLRSIAETRLVFRLGGGTGDIPVTLMTSSVAAHINAEAVRSITENIDLLEARSRFQRDPEAVARQARNAVNALERDMKQE